MFVWETLLEASVMLELVKTPKQFGFKSPFSSEVSLVKACTLNTPEMFGLEADGYERQTGWNLQGRAILVDR